jgi:flagellar biosynthetic protein FliR
MSLDALFSITSFVPVFVLVLFRIAGLMLYAPLLGSGRIPKRVKALLAIILALGMAPGVARPAALPMTTWGVAAAIAGELAFGLAMGIILSFVFVAAQWAGEIVGQEMGLNLSEVFDPQFGGASSVVGDFYYMLTLVIFLAIGGHRQMIRGIRASFDTLPLLSVGINASVFDLLVRMLGSATTLAIRLAAPLMVTMLIVDLTMGFLAKTMPQLNIMTTGMSLKSMVGVLVLLVAISLNGTTSVLVEGINQFMGAVQSAWQAPAATARVTARLTAGAHRAG